MSLQNDPKRSLMISSALLPIIISMLSILEWIMWVSSETLEKIKLIAIVKLIFHSPWVLWLFIISIKYGLILSRYSSIDRFLSLSPLLSYWM